MVDEDIWGQILLDYQEGRPADFVVRRDDGRCEDDSPDYYFAPYEEWLPCERRALEGVSGPVLDLGCGAGRVALWLQTQKIRVVAVDRSPQAVAVARMRGVKDVRTGTALAGSLPKETVRTAVLLGNNLGIAGSLAASEALLRDLRRLLGPHGRIVFSTCDPVGAAAGGLALSGPGDLARANRKSGEYRIRVEYQGRIGPWFGLVFFNRAELSHTAERAGWRMGAIYDCGAGAEGFYAGRLEAVAD